MRHTRPFGGVLRGTVKLLRREARLSHHGVHQVPVELPVMNIHRDKRCFTLAVGRAKVLSVTSSLALFHKAGFRQ